MTRFVLLVAILMPDVSAQPAPSADPEPRLDGGRWVADLLPPAAFVPRLDGSDGEATVWAPPGEIRTSMLEVGVGKGFAFRATIRRAGGAGLRLTFGADPWRTRGWELDVGGPGRKATLHRMTLGGPVVVSSVSWPDDARPAAEHSVEVRVSGGVLTLEIDGRKRSPRGGWRLGKVVPGRFHLGAADGAVRMEAISLSFLLDMSSRQRLQGTLDRGSLPPLPDPREVPLQGPLDLVSDERLAADLAGSAAAVLAQARRLAAAGKVEEALKLLEPLREAAPEAEGPAFVAGALRMLERADAAGALEDLRRARALPGAAALLGDAHWMIGDLQSAAAAFTKAGDLGGRALVQWARGEHAAAAALAKRGRSRGCRRAGQRLRLIDDLAMLHGWPTFYTAGEGRVRVISDLSSARAQRALRMARPFLNGVDGWLPGESPSRPLTVFVCAAGDVFAQWNDRLGGARFEEADGIYRPGTGLVVVLDDDDDEVLRRRVQHECVHHVVWERGWAMPRPFEEGLSELLAHGRPAGRSVGRLTTLAPSRYPLARRLAEYGQFEDPAETLMRLDMRDGDRGREDYAQAWAALWVAVSARGGGPALAELIALSGDPAQRSALQRAIKKQLPKALIVERLHAAR